MKKRRIAIDIGSENDLSQCVEGLRLLQEAVERGEIEVVEPFEPLSIHADTLDVLALLARCETDEIDVLITGAGWANHLSGTSDAILRNTLRNTRTTVIGVSFADPSNPTHTQAAELSVSEVPRSQLIFEDCSDQFVGTDGCTRACARAIRGGFPELTIPKRKPRRLFTLETAIARGLELREAIH